ncbi:hypothetical protein HG531_003466 [Fusarium graminearum]|nr:hypothetical protein HG531_003466 [Fusarium graminearum]
METMRTQTRLGILDAALQHSLRVDIAFAILVVRTLILRLGVLLHTQLFFLNLFSRFCGKGLGAVTLSDISLDDGSTARNRCAGSHAVGGAAVGSIALGASPVAIVHASLETELPASEVHAGDLAHGRVLHVNVERLRLINEGTTVSSHLHNLSLRNLPHSLVQSLDLGRDVGDVLDRTVISNDAVLHSIGPKTHVDKILEKPGVDNLELASKDSALVDVGGVRLKAFVVAKNLRGTGGRHRSNEQTVADTVSLDILSEGFPVPKVRGLDIPHVELENTLRGRGALEGGVGTFLLGELHRRSKGSVVDGLEDLLVQLTSLRRLKGHAEGKKGISETLHTKTNGSVTHVAVTSLLDRVVVDVDDLVQIADNNLSDLVQLLEVVASIFIVDKRGQRQGGKVANSDLIRGAVFNDLSAQVGASDGTKVLLVTLAIAVILVEHERVSGLCLGLKNGVPKFLSLDRLATLTLSLVLFVQSLKFVTVAVTSADLLLTVILSEIKELEDVGVPWFKVDGEGTRSLVTTLVNVTSSVVEHTQHGNDTVGSTIGTGDVRASGTDSVGVQANTTSHLGNHGTSLEGIVDTINAVLLHINKEA